MASSNRREMHIQSSTTVDGEHFVITVTNFPNLLQRTQQYQQSPDQVRYNHMFNFCIYNIM